MVDIPRLRLLTQQLDRPVFESPAGLVSWMGAMQAQDFSMACWAIGIRIPGLREEDVKEAINKGEIIRTHLLRPTWHFVAAPDLGWMLRLTGPAIKRLMLAAEKRIGLDAKYFAKSARLIEKQLQRNGPMSRDQFKRVFEEAGLETGMNLVAHMLMHAELDGVICSGPMKNDKPSYTLVDAWIPKPRALSREESLAELARRYFSSHGPASVRDFSWWSGLNLTESRKALEMVNADFSSFLQDEERYWFREQKPLREMPKHHSLLLPAYDEYLISYKDRKEIIRSDRIRSAISTNGFFAPVLIAEGRVAGTWKRRREKELVRIEIYWFDKPVAKLRAAMQTAVHEYAGFLGCEGKLE